LNEAFRKTVQDLYQRSQTTLNKAIVLHRKEEFSVWFKSLPPQASYLADAVNGFFDNGGVYCYVVQADASEDPKDALVSALEALSSLTDLDLVAVPDAMTLFLPNGEIDIASVVQVQKHVLGYCTAQGNRFAILDGLGGGSVGTVLNEQCKELKKEPEELVEKDKKRQKKPMNGALYFPWIKTSADRCIPPCGHVAGIYARTDGKAGTHKAPANEDVRGVIDLETPVDNEIQDQLNPEGINCLRAFPGRGIRVWGARTLSRDPTWRYVNIRRLVLTLARWIDANMAWAALEPNTSRLWIRIQRELGVYLSKLWQAGALKGETADQAFYIKCDAETNPPEEREAGEAVTEIGLAPASPAEFIVVRIIHRAGTTELD
jgi:phage tail sheath protein FI